MHSVLHLTINKSSETITDQKHAYYINQEYVVDNRMHRMIGNSRFHMLFAFMGEPLINITCVIVFHNL